MEKTLLRLSNHIRVNTCIVKKIKKKHFINILGVYQKTSNVFIRINPVQPEFVIVNCVKNSSYDTQV